MLTDFNTAQRTKLVPQTRNNKAGNVHGQERTNTVHNDTEYSF